MSNGRHMAREIKESQDLEQKVVEHADLLWRISKDLCHERANAGCLTWAKCTEAFVRSTNLLSMHYLGHSNAHAHNTAFVYLNAAIGVLRLGDHLCAIQALKLSQLLAARLKSCQERDAAKAERLRRHQIVLTIPRIEIIHLLVEITSRYSYRERNKRQHALGYQLGCYIPN